MTLATAGIAFVEHLIMGLQYHSKCQPPPVNARDLADDNKGKIMHKRMRNAMLGLLGAGALVGLTPGVASAAITQQTLGAQNCTYYYNNIVTGGTYSGYARLQLVRWDNGTSTTRAYQLNVTDESGDQITKIQTQAVDATTGAAVGSVWTLTKNSGSFYIRDNLGSNG